MNLNFETQGVNFNSKGKPDEIATPQHICDDMSNLFDYTDCNTKIWGDIYCKTGNTLSSIIKHGVNKNNIFAICDNKQSQMLVCRKLYGRILEEVEVQITQKSLEAYSITRRGQVYWVSNWKDTVKYNYQDAYNIIKFVILKEMERTMALEWTDEDGFHIDNIIMNPPYNNDIYLGFVNLSKDTASEHVVAITPAKGINGKSDKNNDKFREKIVPYISDIIYYPCCKDVFDISESGIAYYLIDCNNKSEIKNIENRCNSVIEYNDKAVRSMGNTLLNKAESIINKVKNLTETYIDINTSRTYFVKANQSYGGTENLHDYTVYGGDAKGNKKVCGYALKSYVSNVEDADKYKAIMSFKIGSNCTLDNTGHVSVINPIKLFLPNEICKDDFMVLRIANTEDDVRSFISYMNCSLIKYLLWVANIGANASNKEFWRFVPDPGKFDHIFTDKELYDKYSLTEEEQTIIESVTKERR